MPDMPDMPPEVAARMEAWQKYGSPGPEHERLNVLKGRWKAKVTSWMTADMPPMESRGDAEFVPVLGGRFLEQRFRGEMGGQPFEGFGHFGYDRLRNEYTQTWFDSMSTGMMVMTGTADPTGRVVEYRGKMTDAVTRQESESRQVMRLHPERLEFEFYWPDPSGREFKAMEIVYTRS